MEGERLGEYNQKAGTVALALYKIGRERRTTGDVYGEVLCGSYRTQERSGLFCWLPGDVKTLRPLGGHSLNPSLLSECPAFMEVMRAAVNHQSNGSMELSGR